MGVEEELTMKSMHFISSIVFVYGQREHDDVVISLNEGETHTQVILWDRAEILKEIVVPSLGSLPGSEAMYRALSNVAPEGRVWILANFKGVYGCLTITMKASLNPDLN